MITYFKSQKELAKALISIIDQYWDNQLNEDLLIKQTNEIIDKNIEKVFLDNEYTSILAQRLGKQRIQLLDKILKHSGDK